jgi:hypothetical protein
MKKLVLQLALIYSVCLATMNVAYAGGEEKKVCTDVTSKDGKPVLNKDGTPKQMCKTIKVHKKVEGEKVPDGKK